MAENETTPATMMQAPHPALKRLEKLVGTWNMVGRTQHASADDISGWNTFAWIAGGQFLESRDEILFQGVLIQSLEVIGYDPERDLFPSTVFSNFSGTPAQYYWNVQGDAVTHGTDADESDGDASEYRGRLSADGNTLTGGWRPKNEKAGPDTSTYDAVMTRVR